MQHSSGAMSGDATMIRASMRQQSIRLLLAAFVFVQALIAGAHVHDWINDAPTAVHYSVPTPASGDRSLTDNPADCPRCQLFSLIGTTLLPADVALVLVDRLSAWRADRAFTTQPGASPFSGWRSRAPPALS
jgi:hypothetical protein